LEEIGFCVCALREPNLFFVIIGYDQTPQAAETVKFHAFFIVFLKKQILDLHQESGLLELRLF